MNVAEGGEYLRQALITAGIPRDRIRIGMELARPQQHKNGPLATVYTLTSTFKREKKRVRVGADVLDPPVPGALGAVRSSLASVSSQVLVTITQPSPVRMQVLLARLLEHFISVPLVSEDGTTYTVLTAEQELEVTWNDHDAQDQVAVTFVVSMPGMIWKDHPVIPIDIIVQYELEGGSA